MNTATKVQQRIPFHSIEGHACGTRSPINDLEQHGAFVCNWSGHLLRIPPANVVTGQFAPLCLVGVEPLFVTKVSDNPYVTVSDARLVAADLDLPVNF